MQVILFSLGRIVILGILVFLITPVRLAVLMGHVSLRRKFRLISIGCHGILAILVGLAILFSLVSIVFLAIVVILLSLGSLVCLGALVHLESLGILVILVSLASLVGIIRLWLGLLEP